MSGDYADRIMLVIKILLLAAFPAFFVWLLWVIVREFISQLPSRRRKRRFWYCMTCGYNLTANASGVCPECGTPMPAAERKSARPE